MSANDNLEDLLRSCKEAIDKKDKEHGTSPLLRPEQVGAAIEERKRLLAQLSVYQPMPPPKLALPFRRITPGHLVPIDRLESYLKDVAAAVAKGKHDAAPRALIDYWEAIAVSIVAHEVDSLLCLEDREAWRAHLEPLWKHTAEGMFSLLEVQCRELITGLISAISPISSKNTRGIVLLPILPLGNCLPVFIAGEIYRNKGWTVISPVWNLPRHDRYRNIDIGRKLSDYSPNSFSVLHYVDEWETGTNLTGTVDSILRAGWPADKLAISAVGNHTNPDFDPAGPKWKAVKKKLADDDLSSTMVRLTPSSLQPIEEPPRTIFYSGAARLIGFRKMNFANQLASEMVGLAIELGKDIPKAISDFRASPLQKLSPTPIPDSEIFLGLKSEAAYLSDGGKAAQRKIEDLYLESFPTAPYYLDEWEDFLVASLHRQEQNFLTTALGHVIPCSTIFVSTLVLTKINRVVNSYYLPPMRSNAKIPYHLLRLRGTLAGIPNAFRKLLEQSTLSALTPKSAT